MIEIVRSGFVHNLLKDAVLLDEDIGGGNSDLGLIEPSAQGVFYSYNPVELSSPLKKAELVINSYGGNYYADLVLFARDESIFNDLSERLERELLSPGVYHFWATSPLGTGYIIDSKNNVRAIVADTGFVDENEEARRVREISIGRGGAVPRMLGSLKEFKLNLNELVTYANQYISSCLEGDARTKFGELELSLVP